MSDLVVCAMTLPPPPAEIPAVHTVNGLAPAFAIAIQKVYADLIALGWRPTLRETMRSDARQRYLYGFGRDYDDGRGIVTNAPNAHKTWHYFGLAVDIGEKRYEPGTEPEKFWTDLGKCASARGLTWGGSWEMKDNPHVQFGRPMRASPGEEELRLLEGGGVEAVWRAVGAI